MSTDLQPNPRLEARLREAFDEIIPRLTDDVDPSMQDGGLEVVERQIGFHASAETSRPRRSPRVLTAAAALVIVLGGVGVWTVTGRDAGDGSQTDPAQPNAASSVPTPQTSDAVPVMPRPMMPDPLWRLTDVIDTEAVPPLGLVYLSSAAFDGPMVEIHRVVDGESWAFGTQSTVSVGDVVGTLSFDGVATSLEWVDTDGNRLRASAASVPITMVQAVASKTRIVDGRAVFTGLESWESAAPEAALVDFGRQVEYGYEAPDGRQMSIRIAGGGMNVEHRRSGGEDRLAREIDDEMFAFAEFGDSNFRANVLRGFWAWEFDGFGFVNSDGFLQVAASVTTVDEAAWIASLDPEQSGVGSLDPAGALDALLEGVPLPADLDVEALRQSVQPESQYQVVVGVSGAVACAWLDQWFAAGDSGDDVRRSEAAEALSTSRTWPMLLDIADEGAWPDAVWQWADAVNGLGGIMSGAGPNPPSREEANFALSCQL